MHPHASTGIAYETDEAHLILSTLEIHSC